MSNPDTSSPAGVTPAPRPRNLQGALWMIASGFAFTGFVTLSKVISATYDPGFLAFWRTAIAMLLVMPALFYYGFSILKLHQPGLVFARSIFGTMGFAFGAYAVSDQMGLPLSEFNAVSFSRAMFVTVIAVIFLKETAGWHRWGATLVGFIGVLIMTQPQSGISLGMLFALAAAASTAGAIALVKTLSKRHAPLTLLIWANILSTFMLLPLAIMTWPDTMPPLVDWGWIGLMGVCGVAGQYMYIRGMSLGDASFLSPIDYLRLPMAALVDWGLFQALPGKWTWVGTAIIIAATAYITLREQRLKTRYLKETTPQPS